MPTRALPLIAVTALALVPATSRAQWEGTWTAGPTRIQVSLESWGGDCGPRPQSTTVPGAGQLQVSQDGDHLVFRGSQQRRSDGCWSDNRAVRRVSSSHREGTWQTTCRTPRDDSRAETGTYTLRARGADRLELTDVSAYDWQLNESRCRGTITSTQSFTRVVGSQQPATPALRPPRCEPGAPARLSLRPGDSQVEPGARLRFVAAVTDSAGCPVPSASVRWELQRPAEAQGDLRGGVFTAGPTAAEAEGEFVIVARSGELRAEARVTVRTPDLSDLIARRTGGGVLRAQDEAGSATSETAAGVSARAADGPVVSGLVVWLGIGLAAAASLLALAMLLLRRRRRGRAAASPSAARDTEPDALAGDDEVGQATLAAAGPPDAAAQTAPPAPGPRVCPVCRKPYADAKLGFCPADGSELVDAEAVPEVGVPMICPVCRRGFPAGTRACPSHGEELMPYSLFVQEHKRRQAGDTALAKICPSCGDRYAKHVTFCGKDGAELVLVN